MKNILLIFSTCIGFVLAQNIFAQSVKQKGACGAIYVRVNPDNKKMEIEELPIVLAGHKTLDREHLLVFDNSEEVEVFIKMLQSCNEANPEVENQRFELLFTKETKIIAFGHAEDKYTTKDITINQSDVPKLISALRDINK